LDLKTVLYLFFPQK